MSNQITVENLSGMEISLDVSTGDHDAGNRIFGKVCGVQGNVILAEDARPNFSQPASAATEPEIPEWLGTDQEEIMIYRIEEAAKKSFRRHNSGARGQMVSHADNYDFHLIIAAIQWQKNQDKVVIDTAPEPEQSESHEKPVLYARFLNGAIDLSDDCVSIDKSCATDYKNDADEGEFYEAIPLYRKPEIIPATNIEPPPPPPTAWIERRFVGSEIVSEKVTLDCMGIDQKEGLSKYYELEILPLYSAPLPVTGLLEALNIGLNGVYAAGCGDCASIEYVKSDIAKIKAAIASIERK